MTLKEIVNKRKEFSSMSTQVTNCIVHAHLPFDAQPEDCRLCHADMSSFIRCVLSANEFCNTLLDEVEKVAAEMLKRAEKR